MSFIGKLISHFLNEIIVRTLANNKSFQRFAVKTDSVIKTQQTNAKVVGEEIVNKAKVTGDELLKTHGSKLNEVVKEKAGFNVAVFVSHLKDEFIKDKKKSISAPSNKK